MADQAAVAGNWKLFEIRNTISKGLTDRTISDDFFVFDLLKVLCDDNTDKRVKLQLLGFLEEHALLIINPARLDDVLSSLLDIYRENVKKGSAGNILLGQVLVTMTSIAIVFDDVSREIIFQIAIELLSVISLVNDTRNTMVRSRAIWCLREMELCLPGLLSRKLECLYTLMKAEKTYVHQDYVSLFVCVLRNVVCLLAHRCQHTNQHEATLNDMLCSSRNSLTTYTNEDYEDVSSGTSVLSKVPVHLPESIDTRHLILAISYIVDGHPRFTPPAASSIFDAIVDIMRLVPTLPISVFKAVVLQHTSTMDMVLFHAILRLQITFGERLFSSGDATALVRHQVALANNPSFTSGQCLLFLHWLLRRHGDSLSEDEITLDLTERRHLYPSIFDGIDTQSTKLQLVNLSFPPVLINDESSDTPLSSVKLLHTLVTYGFSPKATTALFKSLYRFYIRHPGIRESIQKLVISLVSRRPQLTPHVINFLNKISLVASDSDDCRSILVSLQEQISSCFHDNRPTIPLTYILQVLHKVTMDTSLSPKSSLRFVGELLQSCAELRDGHWSHGNALLAVIRNLLLYHDIQPIFTDMASLLHRMMTQYDDIDVRDHARLYYMMLTCSTQDKIHAVLSASTEKNGLHLANIVGGSDTFMNQKTLTEVEQPVLSLKRLACSCHWLPRLPAEPGQRENTSDCTSVASATVADYYEKLAHHGTSVRIDCSLSLVEDSCHDSVYAITLYMDEIGDNYEDVPEVRIPYLPKDDTFAVSFALTPKKPLPSVFKITALFCTTTCLTYHANLGHLDLAFSDLFMPLPWQLSNITLHDLHDSLWDDLEIRANEKQSHGRVCIQSVYTIETRLNNVAALLQREYPHLYHTSPHHDNFVSLSIFFPPSCHLLIRLHQQGDRVVVTSATDDWCILGNLQTFLDAIKRELT